MRVYHQVLHMFTQADLLIVNHDHSYSDSVCAMCFWKHVEMFVIVSGAAIWVYAIFEGCACYQVIVLSPIGYKRDKQTNQRKHTDK